MKKTLPCWNLCKNGHTSSYYDEVTVNHREGIEVHNVHRHPDDGSFSVHVTGYVEAKNNKNYNRLSDGTLIINFPTLGEIEEVIS